MNRLYKPFLIITYLLLFGAFTSTSLGQTVTLSTSAATVGEDGASVTLTATADIAPAVGVTVTVTIAVTGGTAIAGDFSLTSTTITIVGDGGNTTGTTTLLGVEDSFLEGDETIIIEITNVTDDGAGGGGDQGPYTESGAQSETVTITDAESLVLTGGGGNIAEDGGTAVLTATVSDGGTLVLNGGGSLSITLTYSGTAVRPADYNNTGNASPETLTLNNTASTTTTTITGADDTFLEGNETVIATMTTGVPGLTIGGTAQTVTITDAESLILSGGATIDEAATTDFTATVSDGGTLALNTGDDLSITLTYSGTATRPGDYNNSEGADPETLTLTNTSSSISTTITPVNDATIELDETVIAAMTTGVAGLAISGSPQTVTITDDVETVLTSPSNAATGQVLNVPLIWNAVAGADQYKLYVNTASDFTGTAILAGVDQGDVTSKAPGGLSDNVTYYWKVVPRNIGSSDTRTASDTEVRSFTTVQQSVTGISPVENSFSNSLTPTLSWPAGPTGTDTYRLEVNTALGFTGTVVFDDDALTTNSQALSGLSNNTKYYWRVTAQSNLAKVSTSAINSFTTKPAAPTLTSPANSATGQALNVSLSWGSIPGDQYTLEVNTASDFTGTAIAVSNQPQSGISKAPGGLSDNTTYYWRVTASNPGTGNTSNASLVRSFTTVQQSVTGISPVENSFSNSLTPTLSWPSTTGADKYRLEVNTALDFTGTVVFDDDALTTNSQALSGLSYNTKYYWRVTAQSNLAKVSTSAINSFTTKLATPTLTSPADNATGVSLTPTLTWSSVTGADNYRLEVNTASDFTGTAIAVSNQPQSGTSKAPGGLSDNTTYYWRVTASNSGTGNTSNASLVRSFTTVQQSVTGISPVENSFSNSINPTLSWPSTTGADKYRLEVNTALDFTGTVVFDDDALTTNSQALSGLSYNTKYYWRVTAQSNLAKVTTSAINSFTTKLATPTLTSPADNATGVSLTPTLTWSSVTGADNYRLEVNTTSDFTGTFILDVDTLTSTSKQITGLSSGTDYFWRVSAINSAGNFSDTSGYYYKFTTLTVTAVDNEAIIPQEYATEQNYPNPFNPTTTIRFALPEASFVTLKIYNMLGQEVKTLVNEHKNAGTFNVQWKGDNDSGNKVSSGTYIYRVIAGSHIFTKKMILLK